MDWKTYGRSLVIGTFTALIASAAIVLGDASSGPGGNVRSVFGRTGVVAAQTGDYTFAQIGSTPTTLAGYGITNGQPLDSDLTGLAALSGTGIPHDAAGTWTLSAISLTADISGILPVPNGGTGQATLTAALDAAFGSTQGNILFRASLGWQVLATATAGLPLKTGGAGANPSWGSLGVAAGGTGGTTFTANGILYGNGTSAFGVTAAGSAGQVLVFSGGTPQFSANPNVTSLTATGDVKGAIKSVDLGGSFYLYIKSNETLTAGRTLNLNMGDATHSFNLLANLTVNANSTIDQDVSTTASPTWVLPTLTSGLKFSGTAPTASTCGAAPAVKTGSTDSAGEITTGAGATACTVTFAAPKATAPLCVVTAQDGTARAYTISTSAIVLAAASASAKYDWQCTQV